LVPRELQWPGGRPPGLRQRQGKRRRLILVPKHAVCHAGAIDQLPGCVHDGGATEKGPLCARDRHGSSATRAIAPHRGSRVDVHGGGTGGALGSAPSASICRTNDAPDPSARRPSLRPCPSAASLAKRLFAGGQAERRHARRRDLLLRSRSFRDNRAQRESPLESDPAKDPARRS
jgi:hypothetical protein